MCSLTDDLFPEQTRWEKYFMESLDYVYQTEVLEYSVNAFKRERRAPGLAIDLGSGTGRTTLYLLKENWHVLSVDCEQLSMDIISERVEEQYKANVEFLVSSFEEMQLPRDVALINATLSLPFCVPEKFNECWEKIVESLSIDGRFSGQFFGNKHDWAGDNEKETFHTYQELLNLFQDRFEIEYLYVEEMDIAKDNQNSTHWHIYHVTAKKVA